MSRFSEGDHLRNASIRLPSVCMPIGSLELVVVAFTAGATLGAFAEWIRRRVGVGPSNVIAVLTMVAIVIVFNRDDSGEIGGVLGLFGSGYAVVTWHGRRPRPAASTRPSCQP